MAFDSHDAYGVKAVLQARAKSGMPVRVTTRSGRMFSGQVLEMDYKGWVVSMLRDSGHPVYLRVSTIDVVEDMTSYREPNTPEQLSLDDVEQDDDTSA